MTGQKRIEALMAKLTKINGELKPEQEFTLVVGRMGKRKSMASLQATLDKLAELNS